MTWLNVQFYEGSDNIQLSDWLSTFERWKSTVASGPNGIPKKQLPSFLVPRCNGATYTLSDIQSAISNVRQQYSTMGVAFVWKYSEIKNDVATWASTMQNALKG